MARFRYFTRHIPTNALHMSRAKHFWSSYTLCTEQVSIFSLLESCDTLFRNAVWPVYPVSFWTNNSAHTALFAGSWFLSWRVTHSHIGMQCGGKQKLLHIPGTQWNFESFSRGWPSKSLSTFIKKDFRASKFLKFFIHILYNWSSIVIITRKSLNSSSYFL
jgi:hypothetical protein